MDLRNSDGDPIDPVPFLVSVCMAAMLLFSVGPLYGIAYGVPVRASLAVSAVGAAAICAVAYHRLVWTAPPPWVHIPPQFRFQRLLYIGVIFGLVLVALSVPLAL